MREFSYSDLVIIHYHNIAIHLLLKSSMVIFYEIMKIVFFLVTILLGLFFSRGRLVFDDNQYLMIQKITMP